MCHGEKDCEYENLKKPCSSAGWLTHSRVEKSRQVMWGFKPKEICLHFADNIIYVENNAR
ncbi:hypothetical protein STEG23_010874, partial [Scotinomys teguina]